MRDSSYRLPLSLIEGQLNRLGIIDFEAAENKPEVWLETAIHFSGIAEALGPFDSNFEFFKEKEHSAMKIATLLEARNVQLRNKT